MNNDDEKIIFICAERLGKIPGKLVICSICAKEVWFGDSSVRSAKAKGISEANIVVQCVECNLSSEFNVFNNIDLLDPLTEEQKKEIIENL